MARATRQRDLTTVDGRDALYAPDRASWRAWLSQHHAESPGVWLVYYKQGSGKSRVPYAEAVEEALCFGWIDSQTMKADAARYMQLFTPRRPRSGWSKINKGRIERLLEQGLMTPAGLARIEAARRDGSWERLDAVETFEMPAELEAALAANSEARRHFEAFPPSTRKGLLYWVTSAKREETRARRIAELVRLAATGQRAGPFG